jgi:hypothetical protein
LHSSIAIVSPFANSVYNHEFLLDYIYANNKVVNASITIIPALDNATAASVDEPFFYASLPGAGCIDFAGGGKARLVRHFFQRQLGGRNWH